MDTKVYKLERAVVRDILAYLKANGGDGYHVHGSELQRRGEPDIDGWLPGGIHLKIECKVWPNKPDPLQEHRLAVYEAAGYAAGVAYSVGDVIRIVNEYLEEQL